MPIFHYTVANKEGKKLSGSVKSPNEKLARTELNNLGFSVLILKEAKENQEENELKSGSSKYFFEAIDKSGKSIAGTIASKNKEKAYARLRSEYKLRVTAIWAEDATEEEINEARNQGTKLLQEALKEEVIEESKNISESAKERQLIKNKVELILEKINQLLKNFEQEIPQDQKAEINKKIDKLLRIKNSTNSQYILKTAEDLLSFIQEQEKVLKEKGLENKRLKLKMNTRSLLEELNTDGSKPKSLSEDIVNKIENWQEKTKQNKQTSNQIINSILDPIKNFFTTPLEIKIIKERIRSYNKQLKEFIILYFKEPAPEYKEKIKKSIKTVWRERKKAKKELKETKIALKEKRKAETINEHLLISFLAELNSLTGWLLFFYLGYYFLGLYLTSKAFNLTNIPNAFQIYESQFFKYILIVLFLLHSCTALKMNFFKKSILANIILIPVFILGSIISLLNF